MELTEEQKEELKLLAEWKRIYNMPEHYDPEIKTVAQIGEVRGCDEYVASCKEAKTIRELPYLGHLPLILAKREDDKVTTVIVNPRYKERNSFYEFILVKYDAIPQEYFDAYADTGAKQSALQSKLGNKII